MVENAFTTRYETAEYVELRRKFGMYVRGFHSCALTSMSVDAKCGCIMGELGGPCLLTRLIKIFERGTRVTAPQEGPLEAEDQSGWWRSVGVVSGQGQASQGRKFKPCCQARTGQSL